MGRCRRTEPGGRHNRSPGRESWVAVLGGRSPVGRHTGSDVVGVEVSSLKGLGDLITCLPSTQPPQQAQNRRLSGTPVTCWATIVSPCWLVWRSLEPRRFIQHHLSV